MSNQIVPKTNSDLRLVIQSEKIQEQLVAALPRHYTPEQFTVIVRTQINRNPKLAECDQGSFLSAMLQAAQMGIAPDGRNGHLIPRFNGKTQRVECTFQPDYKGLVGLVRKNENVADIYAEVVYEHDTFKVTKGLHRDLIHEQDVKVDRGAAIGAYAVIAYKDGTHSWEFMSRADIENVRNRSDSWKAHVAKGYDTPWKTDEGEMFKKTAIKRLIKLADISQETSDRIAADPEFAPPQPMQVEIKPASIPALPQNAEPDDIPMENNVSRTDSAPTAEPKRGRPKKLLVKPEPADPSDQSDSSNAEDASPAGQLRAKLAAIKKTEADLIRVCAENMFCEPTATLSSLPDKMLEQFVEYWDELEEELKK